MKIKKIHILLMVAMSILCQLGLNGQSYSFGNTYVHRDGECVIFGLHDFDDGSMGVYPGIVGTERDGLNSKYGVIGFSDVSPGWKGIGDDTHVDGYVKKYGDGPFVFPIGDNGKYRPIAISGADQTSAAYFKSDPASGITSDIFGGDFGILPLGGPFPQTLKSEIVIEVSDLEYWDIDGSNPTKITLTWDIFSDIERISNDDLSKLSILGWDGEKWQAIPSKMDILYLNKNKSIPLHNGGISNKIQGSISSIGEIVPDQYLAYTFGSIASGTIGDFVWEDINRDGIQNIGEPGIPGVIIELYRNSDDFLIGTTTSDANGLYAFVGMPSNIYYLKFSPGVEYASTIPNQGISALNSDISFNNTTAPFQLNIDENIFGIDAGFYRSGSIGNFVWLDINNNGIQDSAEVGMPEVQVQLLNQNKEPLAATLTNSEGYYTFTNISPNYYMIKVIPPNGFTIGPYKSILNDDIDSDINPIDRTSYSFFLESGRSIDYIDAALSTECSYTAAMTITEPACGEADGKLEVEITGNSGPYTYRWNTGDFGPSANNLDTGYYTLIITDINNCIRTFAIDLEYMDPCEMICADVNTFVNLEGAYNYDEEKMHTKLNSLGYLPGQIPTTFLGKYTDAGQPYDEDPWYMNGIEGITYESNSLAENNLYYPYNAVDWVLVSLRSSEEAEYEACTRAGLLHENGQISFDEDNCCLVDPNKKYFITIEHRNHLVVMTPEAQPVIDGEISFDFRINQSYIRLLGSGQKEISPGVFVMYAANGDQYLSTESAGDINVGDLSEWLRSNGEHSSYYRQDFDLNGDANVQDKGLYLRNIGIFTDVPKN